MNNFIIIPGYNEEKNIAEVILKARNYTRNYAPNINIIVIDDGSGDNTSRRAKEAGALVLRHRINLGKGAALKTGCDYALSQGAGKIVVLDADGQHNPENIPQFLSALENNDIAFGARKVPESMPLVFKAGNAFINRTLKLLYGLQIEDSQCGFRAFTAETYRKIRWEALDYYVETEMLIKAGKNK